MEKEFSKEEMIKEAVEEAKKAAKEQQTEMEETAEEVTDEELAEEKDSEAGEDGAEKKDKKLFKRKPKKDKKDEQIEELTDRLTRQMAEFDNFRKRTEKEKSAMYEVGAKDIIEKILPVIDNFERGLSAVTEEQKDDSFVTGMEMIYKQIMTTLDGVGVKVIEAVGQEFNPDLHNAVMHVEDEEAGENIIVEEFHVPLYSLIPVITPSLRRLYRFKYSISRKPLHILRCHTEYLSDLCGCPIFYFCLHAYHLLPTAPKNQSQKLENSWARQHHRQKYPPEVPTKHPHYPFTAPLRRLSFFLVSCDEHRKRAVIGSPAASQSKCSIHTTKKLCGITRAREGSNRATPPVAPVATRPYHEPMYLFI